MRRLATQPSGIATTEASKITLDIRTVSLQFLSLSEEQSHCVYACDTGMSNISGLAAGGGREASLYEMDNKKTSGGATQAAPERPTLKTIAFMTGLGITTVSRALKDAPDIGAETKERVRMVARNPEGPLH